MFIILLRFGAHRARASEFAQAHGRWIQHGLADGVFLLAGSLKPQAGGVILAHGLSAQALRDRVQQDPFVAHEVVSAEIVEVEPSRVDERLQFLLADHESAV